ncbi:MAG: SCO family protein [Caulobacter sp.]|nr:SCO family protein [Vitreoscilla sp.]
MISRRFLFSLAAAVALALSGCDRAAPPHHYNAFDITGATYAQGFDLPDFDGKPRQVSDFAGKLTVVFFGYTQCPDACPTTMAELSGILKSLGPDASRVQVVFITVDPSRDTPALLKNYVTNFRPDFLALRGDEAQTKQVIHDFKLVVEKVPGKTADSYTIDHTAGTYIFDTQGRVRLFASQSLDPALLTDDMKALLAEKR